LQAVRAQGERAGGGGGGGGGGGEGAGRVLAEVGVGGGGGGGQSMVEQIGGLRKKSEGLEELVVKLEALRRQDLMQLQLLKAQTEELKGKQHVMVQGLATATQYPIPNALFPIRFIRYLSL
jgi:hypothetical protein